MSADVKTDVEYEQHEHDWVDGPWGSACIACDKITIAALQGRCERAERAAETAALRRALDGDRGAVGFETTEAYDHASIAAMEAEWTTFAEYRRGINKPPFACAPYCSSLCEEADEDGPCDHRHHFDVSSKIHVACSCGALAAYKTLGAPSSERGIT